MTKWLVYGPRDRLTVDPRMVPVEHDLIRAREVTHHLTALLELCGMDEDAATVREIRARIAERLAT